MRLIVLTVALALGLAGHRAHAYPQLQLSSGADRCLACHFSPAGGGLINDYGRLEAGDTLSRAGDGAFLHGLWSPPSWFQLGADLRLAGLARGSDADRETAAFPMQTDVYVRPAVRGFSLDLTLGLRGGARDPQPPLVERLTSREHYVMYQRGERWYVRAGRFAPIHGVRTQDHTAYVRRHLQLGTLEEPYGIAGGVFGASWEGHVSAFVPPPIAFLGAGPYGSGAAVYVERRLMGDAAAIAGQSRVVVGADDTRISIGGVGKRWFESARLLLLGEVDLQRQSFDGSGPTRYGLATYAGATHTLTRGLWLGAVYQRWQPDLRLRTARDAFELDLQYFPYAHVELHLLTRAEAVGGNFDDPDLVALLQLHYYL